MRFDQSLSANKMRMFRERDNFDSIIPKIDVVKLVPIKIVDEAKIDITFQLIDGIIPVAAGFISNPVN